MNIEDDQEELNHQPEQLSKELMDTNGTQEHSKHEESHRVENVEF